MPLSAFLPYRAFDTHSVIVSSELGIRGPAVAAATWRIPTGAVIAVNGA